MYWTIGIAVALVAVGVVVWFFMRRRRRHGPIRAIALLQSRARLLSDVKLRAAIERAWGVHLPENGPEDATDFVAVVPGAPTAFVQIDGVRYLINSFPTPYLDDPASAASGITDLRLRTIIAEHKAWMSVDLMGNLPEGWDERMLYSRLGKLAAEIAADDTLGFYFTQHSLIYQKTPDTIAALRSDDVLENLQQNADLPVVQMSDNDPEMDRAVEEAQARLPEFVRRFEAQDGKHFSIKAPITSAGNTEFIWIDVTTIDATQVTGELGNEPANLPGYKLGQRVRVKLDDIVDWMIVTNPEKQQFDGGFSVAVVMKRYAQQRR
jgi:uncharacterized protein YegJ (DUF2314 family)